MLFRFEKLASEVFVNTVEHK